MKEKTESLANTAKEISKTVNALNENSYDAVIITLLKCADPVLKKSIIAGLMAGVKINQKEV